MERYRSASISFLVTLHLAALVSGHGRLLEPPSRASMWRFGFKNPANYDDHQLFCGGLTRMIRNGARCGICGDALDEPQPRPHEAGGRYANGILVREYQPGQTIDVTVELTAHHKGYFEFRLCPHNNPRTDPNEVCFQNYVLRSTEGTGKRYYLPESSTNGMFNIKYHLPEKLTCAHCILQWTYVAGNNWGKCENGTEGIGCGPQETFRACADVSIGGDVDNEIETNEIPGASHHSSASSLPQLPKSIFIMTTFCVVFLLRVLTFAV